jgi:hypothetical protein
MRVSINMNLAPLRAAMGEASLLDAVALRDVLLRRGVTNTDDLSEAEWSDAVRTAYRRLPKHLRPETP